MRCQQSNVAVLAIILSIISVAFSAEALSSPLTDISKLYSVYEKVDELEPWNRVCSHDGRDIVLIVDVGAAMTESLRYSLVGALATWMVQLRGSVDRIGLITVGDTLSVYPETAGALTLVHPTEAIADLDAALTKVSIGTGAPDLDAALTLAEAAFGAVTGATNLASVFLMVGSTPGQFDKDSTALTAIKARSGAELGGVAFGYDAVTPLEEIAATTGGPVHNIASYQRPIQEVMLVKDVTVGLNEIVDGTCPSQQTVAIAGIIAAVAVAVPTVAVILCCCCGCTCTCLCCTATLTTCVITVRRIKLRRLQRANMTRRRQQQHIVASIARPIGYGTYSGRADGTMKRQANPFYSQKLYSPVFAGR